MMVSMSRCKLSLRALSLALLLPLAACDDGTEPGLEGLDADRVSAAVEGSLQAIDATADAHFVLSDFVASVLGGAGTALDGQPVAESERESVRSRRLQRFEQRLEQRLERIAALLAPEVDIPSEIRGQTFVWEPGEEAWVPDSERTGAPENGVRIIWYAIDDLGNIVVPLHELGYIDLTEEDTPALDRLGVRIVRTEGEMATLADYIYAYDHAEAQGAWTEYIELIGTFGSAAEAVDVEVLFDGAGDLESGDESYEALIFADGPEGSYRWALTGSLDGAALVADDVYAITVVQEGVPTTLLLETLTDAAGDIEGAGSLSHDGTTVAEITVTDSQFSFEKPGGGSFSHAEASRLEELVFVLFFYGPVLLILLPFVAL